MVWAGCYGAEYPTISAKLRTFRVILATQVAAFAALIIVRNPWVFGILICYVLLCYGGGFGVMPSFVLNTFGSRLMPVIYGCVLTAWSAAGVVGPQVIRSPERSLRHPGSRLCLWLGRRLAGVGVRACPACCATRAKPRSSSPRCPTR